MEPWLIVGAGRCGLQLAWTLHRKRCPFAGVVARSAASRTRALRVLPAESVRSWDEPFPQGVCVLLAVRDREIPETAAALRQAWAAFPVVLHASGALGPEVLAPLRELGAAVGVFHPLLPFPHPVTPRVRLSGACATLSGDPRAVAAGDALARALGMHPVACPTLDWPLYHAAANLAGPLLYALLLASRKELQRAGFPPQEAKSAVRALAAAILQQASHAEAWELLTGPIPRQDWQTIAAHLAALSPPLQAVYRALARLPQRPPSEPPSP